MIRSHRITAQRSAAALCGLLCLPVPGAAVTPENRKINAPNLDGPPVAALLWAADLQGDAAAPPLACAVTGTSV